jgi:hemoglobin
MSDEDSSVYERIGGEEGIALMVDEFYGRVLADSELEPFFKNVPMERLTKMQREFFSAATGGPIVYSGMPLSHVHEKLGITLRHFQRFTEHLIETLEEKGVNQQEILDLISRINLYSDEITNRSNVDG